MGAIKWVGGVLGWAVGGPIGAVLGFAFGSMFDNAMSGQFAVSNNQSDASQRGFSARNRPQTQSGDFGVSLLMLAASVMKSDRQVVKAELDYVKVFFKRQFGQEKAENYILMLRELLKQNYDLRDVCMQIKLYMDHASRLQLLHFLFGIAAADGQVHELEHKLIAHIAMQMGISEKDYQSIESMFVAITDAAYKILEVEPEATDDEMKKAYRKMALKYHPDKVHYLGEDVQNAANDKFQKVNKAWETIKKQRGIV